MTNVHYDLLWLLSQPKILCEEKNSQLWDHQVQNKKNTIQIIVLFLDNKIKEEANCLCNIKYFLWLSCFNAVSNIINFDHFHNTLNTLTKEHTNIFI